MATEYPDVRDEPGLRANHRLWRRTDEALIITLNLSTGQYSCHSIGSAYLVYRLVRDVI